MIQERSSSTRRAMFKEIQLRTEEKALQLLLDMPIRWSSTFVMLDRAESKKTHVNTFVYELGVKESDLRKRTKIDALMLSPDEWIRVRLFTDLLAHADRAQQAFSSDAGPSLHYALPALEGLHKAWLSRSEKVKYIDFTDALSAGVEKINEYYEKTADSDAYIFAMCMLSLNFYNDIYHVVTFSAGP
ncbi:hypothetical protein BJ138DRAFT_1021272 [Hygrophoropsis aurantiaca]|uniref:Uncharacterized protein n=1 Tax=Hygrophoropsis aurantiaca TaxID=72124 RepID=A0ACB7ZPI5_9AGAM|nr:hypothetical protein BJ138DRAFT_1021272 [Hygrophoropsis aurantiaca]